MYQYGNSSLVYRKFHTLPAVTDFISTTNYVHLNTHRSVNCNFERPILQNNANDYTDEPVKWERNPTS